MRRRTRHGDTSSWVLDLCLLPWWSVSEHLAGHAGRPMMMTVFPGVFGRPPRFSLAYSFTHPSCTALLCIIACARSLALRLVPFAGTERRMVGNTHRALIHGKASRNCWSPPTPATDVVPAAVAGPSPRCGKTRPAGVARLKSLQQMPCLLLRLALRFEIPPIHPPTVASATTTSVGRYRPHAPRTTGQPLDPNHKPLRRSRPCRGPRHNAATVRATRNRPA